MGKNLKVGILVLMIAMVFAAAPALAQDKLVIWWNKSFVPQQDEAFKEIVQKWEKKTGKAGGPLFFCSARPPRQDAGRFRLQDRPRCGLRPDRCRPEQHLCL